MHTPLQNVLWSVVDESFDEAEYLWRSWESSLDTHARNYREVWFWTEDRLAGSLDGVLLGADRACEELLAPGIERTDAVGTFAVSAHVLAAMNSPVAWELLWTALHKASGDSGHSLRRALEVLARPEQVAALELRLGGKGDAGLPWLISSRTFRKVSSTATQVQELASSHVSDHRRIAMAAARLLPAQVARKILEPALSDIDSRVVAAAVESGLVHGFRSAWVRCLELGAAQTSAASFFWMACLGGERERRLLMAALAQPRTFDLALQALGFLGTKEAANVALQAMRNPAHARLAAEAFCAITGLNLPAQNLAAPEPPALNEPLPFELDDMTADLVPKLDDLLPLPDVEGITRWWSKNEGRFDQATRYIGGQALCPEALYEALALGPMRRRHVLGFELAVRTGGSCDLQTRGFYALQRQQLRGIAEQVNSRSMAFSLEQPSRA
jgi:uncharacterized protein (TIGR02270 family)